MTGRKTVAAHDVGVVVSEPWWLVPLRDPPEGALDATQIDVVAHGVDVNPGYGLDDEIWACLQTLTIAVGAEVR